MGTPIPLSSRSGIVVLVVGPSEPSVLALALLLEATGYRAHVAATAAEAQALMSDAAPDAIILDLHGTADAALALCAAVTAGADVPVLVCTASGQKALWTAAGRLGVADFLTTPVDADELEARLEAALRRSTLPGRRAAPPLPIISVGDLRIRHMAREVTLGGTAVALTPTEYRLLHALASRPGETILRAELTGIVWDAADRGLAHSLDVHTRRLRGKLRAPAGAVRASLIVAVRGVGYRLVSATESVAHGHPAAA